MIEISLNDRLGDSYVVDAHAAFVDFAERDSLECVVESRVGCAIDNLVAPLVAQLHGRTAIETYPDLAKATARLVTEWPTRDDGSRLVALLTSWTRRWPAGRWVVSGAEGLPLGYFSPRPIHARYSARSLSVDPFASGITIIGDGERMDTIDAIALEQLAEEIHGDALLQRDSKVTRGGGGGKGRVRKDRRDSVADRNAKRDRALQDDGMERSAVLSVRISATAKTALEESGVKKELIEEIGAALASGRSIAEVRRALGGSGEAA